MNYFALVRTHAHVIAFGFVLTFFSSFGQTFFIGVFGRDIRETFGLTHKTYGEIYSAATLVSSFSLIWLGSTIDRFDLRWYTRVVTVGLIAGAVLLATVQHVLLLGVALYFLRLFGQGLMGHTAMTTMSRFFHTSRGKALSIAALGWPIGEALFPRAFVAVKSAIGWRDAWITVAILVALLLAPVLELLFRKWSSFHSGEGGSASKLDRSADSSPSSATIRSWTRAQVMRDPRFYCVLPAVLAPPFIATGLFFHQVALAESKGWSIELFASTFIAFAATQLTASLISGPLVDRLGASRLLVFYLTPLGLALGMLSLSSQPIIAFAFMATAGASAGVQSTIIGAYWAEAYGTDHLGSIRSLVMALMVFSTAAAPVLMGILLDRGTNFERIAVFCLVFVIAASGLAVFRRHERYRAIGVADTSSS